MNDVNDKDAKKEIYLASRISDFFNYEGLPWHKQLWTISTYLSLSELLEGTEALFQHHLSNFSYGKIKESTGYLIKNDIAAFSQTERKIVTEAIKDLKWNDPSFYQLQEIIKNVSPNYLNRWVDVIKSDEYSIEKAARFISSHLLDIGFSSIYLMECLKLHLKNPNPVRAFLEEVNVNQKKEYDILVIFEQCSCNRPIDHMPENWLPPEKVSEWLRENSFSSSGVCAAGGLLLKIKTRDKYSAAIEACDLLRSIINRISIGTKKPVKYSKNIWIKGELKPQKFPAFRRAFDVKALKREHKLYVIPEEESMVDPSLELVAMLENGPSVPAAATSWAAIESVLLGYGNDDKSKAAGRFADIVACSFPRAELTSLAYSHIHCSNDELSQELQDLSRNKENVAMASRLAMAIRDDHDVQCATRSDSLALLRMKELVTSPDCALTRIRDYVQSAILRLYRQRNLIMHWGKISPVALDATLRTSAPLIGAGFDRICHAWFVNKEEPLHLAAKARTSLGMLKGTQVRDIAKLLD